MKSITRLLTITAALLWSVLFLTQPAHAYLDPGTGSYFLQILLAALLGAGFWIKMYWGRLKMMFKGNGAKRDQQ